jgi:hypothetical protein
MKNPTTFIIKDGVSDADLIAAARDMYGALQRMLCDAELSRGAWHASIDFEYAYDAIAKARGES